MKRKIFVIALVLILFATLGVSAYEKKSKTFPWMASFNGNGQLNLYAGVGFYGYGIDVSAGPEIIIANFDLGGIPLEFGVMARGIIGFSSFFGYASWIDWGVAPMASLHWGVDFGSIWKFDWYIALGLGIYGSTGTYYFGNAVGFGFASFDGVAWHFADKIALLLDYGYVGYVGAFGIGIKLSL
jgi:hypothetical protein